MSKGRECCCTETWRYDGEVTDGEVKAASEPLS